MITRETWRKNWLGSLARLTSVELQRVSWLDRQNKSPQWTFIEFMCSYEDCLYQEELAHYLKVGFISKDELIAVEAWHDSLQEYVSPIGTDYDHGIVLQDPKWLALVEKGNAARERLVDFLSDEERIIIKNSLIYTGPSKWP